MGTRLLGIVLWGRVYWAWSNGDASTWHNLMGMRLLGNSPMVMRLLGICLLQMGFVTLIFTAYHWIGATE